MEESGARIREGRSGSYRWKNLPRRGVRTDKFRVSAGDVDGGSEKNGARRDFWVPRKGPTIPPFPIGVVER